MISVLVLGTNAITAQIRTRQEQAALLAQVAEDEKAVAVCEKAMREEQIKKFGKLLPRVSGHCWGGCPVRVVKPYYPETARRLKLKGDVLVNTIVDENGKVIFGKVAKGNLIFRKAALAAAYKSEYQPKVTCGDRPIKFRWTIKYSFYPEM